MRDLPLVVVALVVSAYWLRVGAMAVHVRRRHGHGVGLIPERRSERLLWLVVVPVVAAWCALPWLAIGRTGGPLAVPSFAISGGWVALRWAAALVAGGCLAMTLRCWSRMGSEW
ncbi:MAG: hypothetical protein JSS46_09675, partial [Proteobacteria bacterium]|nr:hypothetical protein [Pseudomonadota bacterium]